jgi:hypothetical protein
MRSCPSISLLRALLRRYPALITPALMLFFFAACSLRKHGKEKTTEVEQAAPSEAATEAAEEPSPEPTPAPPSVTVHISYAHRGDYTESLSVDKFAGATLIPTLGEKAGSALVRFEGGEPVWAIAADRGVSGSLLGHMPVVEENKKFALTEVTYGTVPKHFAKEEPENSDPEPLEPGKYYIFTVRRASGVIGYQAVHITADGAIESYEAQPRVGTSYELCCDVATDFASPESANPESAAPDYENAPGGGAVEPQ